MVSPRVGRLIEVHGGRLVLAGSAVWLAAGLVVLGLAPNLPLYMLGWALMGVGMGAGLYDPAFATLGRLFGDSARSSITHLTLIGGFASTVCWPLSAYLVDHVGWRGACFVYAAINLGVVAPLYLFGVPREERRAATPPDQVRAAAGTTARGGVAAGRVPAARHHPDAGAGHHDGGVRASADACWWRAAWRCPSRSGSARCSGRARWARGCWT